MKWITLIQISGLVRENWESNLTTSDYGKKKKLTVPPNFRLFDLIRFFTLLIQVKKKKKSEVVDQFNFNEKRYLFRSRTSSKKFFFFLTNMNLRIKVKLVNSSGIIETYYKI